MEQNTGNLTMEFQTMSQLGDTLKRIIQISKGSVRILDPVRVRGPLIERLVWTATFHEKAEMRGAARWIIKMSAPHMGITFHAPQSLDEILRKKNDAIIKIPAISLKGMVYGAARTIFRVAVQKEVGIFVFELPQTEKGRNYMTLLQFAPIIAAAGIQERFTGPLFIDTSPQSLIDKCQSEARIHLSSERAEVIYNNLSTTVKKQVPEQTSRNNTASLEKFLWHLPDDTQAKICSELEENFASLCLTLKIVQTKQAIKEGIKPTESAFSIRDEIDKASAE